MKLSRSDLQCLLRTRILANEWAGKRVSDHDVMAYARGSETSQATWSRLCKAGLVRNCRKLPGVALTPRGAARLRDAGL